MRNSRQSGRMNAKTDSEKPLLIKNGSIHTAVDSYKGDILIRDGKIVQIACSVDLWDPATQLIDASGLEIYPGGIDVHTHFELQSMGTISADTFETGTIAAAAGGTTTIIDFATPSRGDSVVTTLKKRLQTAEGNCAVDYGFHVCLVDYNDRIASEIPKIIKAGVTSFKCFFAYETLKINDSSFLKILDTAAKAGALVTLHAENGDILSFLMERLISEGKTAACFHSLAHPEYAEAEAVHRAVILAEQTKTPLYIVHLSCNAALDEVKNARCRGLPVFAETCPQYLVLSDDLYENKGFDAAKWIMSPPLRNKSNQEKLWTGLRDGFIQTVATDHCPFNFKTQKSMGRDCFTKIPNGIPGVEDRIKILYSQGVKKGRLTKNQFAAAIATNPARIFGLSPEKGTIAVGSDADLLVIDPMKKGVISAKFSRHNVDYSPFEGLALEGIPEIVISRGKIIFRHGKYTGCKTHGKFLKRKKFRQADWGF